LLQEVAGNNPFLDLKHVIQSDMGETRMTSRGSIRKRSIFQATFFTLFLALLAIPAWADDAQTDSGPDGASSQVDESEDEIFEEDAADLDRVVVTGSRLQRETYTSIAPLQIITAQGSREAGLIDAADILQNSTAAGGLQIDLTFTGLVLDNGPGASTIDLRGLGAGRTLVLLNGRRLAPSGVEGVPVAPDLNLIPGSMVRQYDVLLDGASSVYGSDAVAGVTNILMRKDFDGFEFDVFYNHPDQKNGRSYTVNALYGLNFDRGFFGVGLEYQDSEAVRYRDRSWTSPCDIHHEIDENGKIRTEEQFYPQVYGMEWDECRLGSLAGRTVVPFAGSVYYTPGYSNGGWPEYSESSAFGFGVDGNGDGMTDLTFRDYDLNGTDGHQNTMLYPESDRISLMAYGEYTFDGEMNNTFFFEFNYNERDFYVESQPGQLFPDVPAFNPYNICNPDGIRGVDCGLAQDALYTNPNFIDSFANQFAGLCEEFDIPLEFCTPETFGLLSGPIGAAVTTPIVSVLGDRNITSTNMKQVRGVLGFKGDLPFVDWGSLNNWIYDAALVYTSSDGSSTAPGVRGDRLDLALGWYSTSNTPCENNVGAELASDAAPGCVPVDMYAPSLYPIGVVTGDFGSQAERDYLFGTRDFDTEYEQTMFTAYANGFLFEMQGGTAMGGLGLEWRQDEINSIPNEVAAKGLLWGFTRDAGASGKKWTREIFGEIELPILAGKKGADELRLNLSARYTDDEYYGSDTTWSTKLGWRPTPSLLLRGTAGTSFRAPNLREVFLRAQTGFPNVTDPCVVPEDATNPIDGSYIPELDNRDPIVLENCVRTGVDPTMLDNNGFNTYSVETAAGGNPDLKAETSFSYTYGFAFEQPWSESFDLVFGATYYDIDIDDTIIEPTAQFLVNQCYNDPQGDSTFCDKLRRDGDGFLDLINARFVNRDNAHARGVDINANFDKAFNIGSHSSSVALDLVVNHNIEASTTFINDDGTPDFDEDTGEIGFAKWKGQLGMRFNVDDFRFTWVVNYIGPTDQDPDFVDEFDEAITGISDTCVGPPTDVLCRDYMDTDDYWLHSTSFYWYGDSFTAGIGIRNVFDESPPFVDSDEYYGRFRHRLPIGGGYDLMGRTFFVNVIWKL
jgi:iron complex outermembrane receptor protein